VPPQKEDSTGNIFQDQTNMAKKNDDYQDEYQEVLKGLFDLIKEHAKDAFF